MRRNKPAEHNPTAIRWCWRRGGTIRPGRDTTMEASTSRNTSWVTAAYSVEEPQSITEIEMVINLGGFAVDGGSGTRRGPDAGWPARTYSPAEFRPRRGDIGEGPQIRVDGQLERTSCSRIDHGCSACRRRCRRRSRRYGPAGAVLGIDPTHAATERLSHTSFAQHGDLWLPCRDSSYRCFQLGLWRCMPNRPRPTRPRPAAPCVANHARRVASDCVSAPGGR